MRIGIGLGQIAGRPATPEEIVAQAERAEREGFASGWLANVFGIDAITACALAGIRTSKIELGTAVVPTYPRHPFAMAQAGMSAQAACSGRFALGIGLSHQIVIEGMFGMSFAKPYSHMKEYLSVLVPLVREGRADFDGAELRAHTPLIVEGATPCPILVAALAPKMLALTGEVADGTITWMTGAKTIRDHTAPRIREAAAKAGRPEPRIVVGLPVAVTKETAKAREVAGNAFQIYGSLPSYRAMLDREGAEGPGDVAIVGDEDEVATTIRALEEGGATDFMLVPFPVGDDPEASIERTRSLFVKLARGAR